MQRRMQSTAKPRPKKTHKKIEFGRRLDLGLKISVSPHRLVLPKIGSDFEQTTELDLNSVKDFPHLFPLGAYVAGR